MGSSIGSDDLSMSPSDSTLLLPEDSSLDKNLELETDLECPICVELLCEPIKTPCNHRFCMNCLAKAQRLQGHACPICRTQCMVPAEDLPEDEVLAEALSIV